MSTIQINYKSGQSVTMEVKNIGGAALVSIAVLVAGGVE